MTLAKGRGIATFLVGHVTKDGALAGPARARAPGRHRALLRGRAPPRLPRAARGEEPLRLHERDRRLRDGRARARRGAEPVRLLPRRAAGGRAGLGDRREPRGHAAAAARAAGARGAAPRSARRGAPCSARTTTASACCWRCWRSAPALPLGEPGRLRQRRRRRPRRRAGGRSRHRARRGVELPERPGARATCSCSARSGSPARCARSAASRRGCARPRSSASSAADRARAATLDGGVAAAAGHARWPPWTRRSACCCGERRACALVPDPGVVVALRRRRARAAPRRSARPAGRRPSRRALVAAVAIARRGRARPACAHASRSCGRRCGAARRPAGRPRARRRGARRVAGGAGPGAARAVALLGAWVGGVVAARRGRASSTAAVPAPAGVERDERARHLGDHRRSHRGRRRRPASSTGRSSCPQFVLRELQQLADSQRPASGALAAAAASTCWSGCSGSPAVQVEMDDGDVPRRRARSTRKLVALARARGARLLTNDYDLGRMAALSRRGGAEPQRSGRRAEVGGAAGRGDAACRCCARARRPGQGVAYLDDGTMVVVEERQALHSGRRVDVVVTSVLPDLGRAHDLRAAARRGAGARCVTSGVSSIPAGGVGARLGRRTPKQFLRLGRRDDPGAHPAPLHPASGRARRRRRGAGGARGAHAAAASAPARARAPVEVVRGGADAPGVGLAARCRRRRPSAEIVLVHDAVRPFITRALIDAVVAAAAAEQGAATLRAADRGDGQAGARRGGREHARSSGALGGADAAGVPGRAAARGAREGAARRRSWAPTTPMLVERLGHPVPRRGGPAPSNVKITTPRRSAARPGGAVEPRRLRLRPAPARGGPPAGAGRRDGAVGVGLDGHSDADVLSPRDRRGPARRPGARAIWVDTFPDTDPRYRGISSLLLLRAGDGARARRGAACS